MSQHPFERSGCGRAPFRFVGIDYRVGPIKQYKNGQPTGLEIGAPGQPMGCCRHCGQGIAECCIIEDADGKRFVVGNVCVGKTDRKLHRVTDPEIKKLRKANRERREDERIDKATALFKRDDIGDALLAIPSPNTYRAKKHGETGFDFVEFMLTRAGRTGMMKAARLVEKIAEQVELDKPCCENCNRKPAEEVDCGGMTKTLCEPCARTEAPYMFSDRR